MQDFPSSPRFSLKIDRRPQNILKNGLSGLSGLFGGFLRFAPSAKRVFLHPSFILLPLTFFLILAPCALRLGPLTSAFSAEVRLAWDPNTEPDVAGYVVYYGNATRNYQYYVDVGNQATATLTNLSEGRTYYLSITAYNSADNESDFSDEIIYQALAPAPACGYSISPTSQSFGSSNVTGAVNVTTQTGCTWNAASNASWIIRTSNSSVTGNGTVNYSVQQNSDSTSRTGTMTIAGKTFSITQAGQSQTQFILSLKKSGNGNGAVTTDPQGSVFTQGTAVKLTATPDPTSTFIGWSGACPGTSNTCSLAMDANKSVTASFSLKTYTISASAGSNGSISPWGTVTVNHGGTQAYSIATNSGYRIEDVKVDGLSVRAVSSYTFSNVTKNRMIQATFASLIYSLNLTKTGTGTGTITASPSGTSFSAGTVVTLGATPDSSSTFSGWSGGCTGTSLNCSVTMNSNVNVTATFTLKSYTITASAGPNGSISPQGHVAVNHGASQSFTITPSSGYKISDVKTDGTSVSTVSTFTFGNVAANHILEANFTPSDASQPLILLNLEEGKGTTAFDNSGYNNHGTIYGAAYTIDSAVGAYALSFDGSDDKVVLKRKESLKPSNISVSLWVKHMKDTNPPSYGGIIQGAYGDGYHHGFRILDYYNKPLVQINFGESSPKWILGNPLSTGEWCHLVLTYDHRYIKLYQNGQLLQTVPETRNINWNMYSSNLYIGWAQWYFRGTIDDVKIYGFAVPPMQVEQLYSQRR